MSDEGGDKKYFWFKLQFKLNILFTEQDAYPAKVRTGDETL